MNKTAPGEAVAAILPINGAPNRSKVINSVPNMEATR